MKAIAIVIGLVLALMPMAFAQQPGGEGTTMDIEAALPIIGAAAGVGGIIAAILGTVLGACWSCVTPIWALIPSSIEATLGDIATALCVGPLSTIDAIIGDIATLMLSWAGTLCGFNLLSAIGTVCVSVQSIAGTILGVIVAVIAPIWASGLSILGTLAGACFSCVTPIWTAIPGILGTLWAGLNDIDLTSYLFQSVKICALALCDPLVWCIRWTQLIPCVSWIWACFSALPQLLLLWNNCCVRLFQHAAPVV
jgi:hypothetical protein